MRGQLTCCVVLPAFNEGRHLRAVIDRLPAWLDGIVVVDDASTDDTLAVAEALDDPRLVVVHHETNQGVGGAMVTGYRAALEAGFDIVVKMDADEQMDALGPPGPGPPHRARPGRVREGQPLPPHRPSARDAAVPLVRQRDALLPDQGRQRLLARLRPAVRLHRHRATDLSRLKLDGIARDYFFENDMLIRLNVIDARVVDVEHRRRSTATRSRRSVSVA